MPIDHVSIPVADLAVSRDFYSAALAPAAGDRDHGAPGERPYGPRHYAAFVIDPDGHNIEAVYKGGT